MSETVPLLWNPRARGAQDADELLARLRARGDLEVVVTDGEEAVREAIARARDRGSEVVAAAGGDGTARMMARCLLETGEGAPGLALVPLGTGNDLGRSLALPADPDAAAALASTGDRRAIDVLEIATEGEERLGVNMVTAGNSAAVLEAIDDDMKRRWGPFVYLRGFLEIEMQPYGVRLEVDGTPWEADDVLTLLVANGRFSGGGLEVAPRASLEDGLLDVIVVHDRPGPKLAALGAQLLASEYLASEAVTFQRGREIDVAIEPQAAFTLDGDLLEEPPRRLRVRPGALDVVVGDAYLPRRGET